MCIDNTNEMNFTINVTLDIHDVMQQITSLMKKEENLKSDDEKMFKKYEKLKNFVMDLGKH